MYTEENEFDYDDYDKKNNGGFINKDLIIKIILIVICLLIIIFLVFKVKNLNNKGNDNKSNSPVIVFNNNIEMLRSAGEDYFFTKDNMPKNDGETIIVSIKELKNENYVTDVLDYDGNKCGYNTSYVSVTKNSNDYLMKINLVCSSMEDSIEYYYDLNFNCLTCNGEDYTPSDTNTDSDTDKNTDNDTDSDTDKDSGTDKDSDGNSKTCGDYGEWTTEFKNDPSLEYETRVLIKAYKIEKVYGEYSTPTKTKPDEKTGIEIKSYEETETVSEYTDWTTTNEKPEEKTGREIETSTESTPYSSTSCKNVTTTYTKKITGTDKKAVKCSAVKGEFMKYVCTYKKTEKKCSTTTNYTTTTTYSYRDLVEKQQQVTYYQTRTVTDNTVYTDYILESDIPSGYQKLNGSEITQYRYRQVCSK